MIQSRNGQSQSVSEQSKPRSRFTGERLKLLRPDTYRQAVELSAEPREQVPYDHICRLLRVSEHTLKAIEARESLSIAERNKGSWTRRYVSRVKPQIASKIKSTTPISCRPLSLLEWLRKRPLQINLYPGMAELLHQRYQELIAALPNGETISEPPGAMDLQSGQENLQK
jgi:hypothetical protein